MSRGTIMLLNGTSSAGKSSVARALQDVMDEPYLHTGADHFQLAHPPGMIQITDDPAAECDGWLAVYGDDGLREVRIGPLGRKMIAGVYRAVAALSDTGLNVIVDDALVERSSLEAAVSTLHGYLAYFICLDISLATAEAREQDRGDRGPGNARYFYDRVYGLNDVYDLRVDSEVNDPEACALAIRAAIETNQPSAIDRLYREMQTGAK